MRVDSEVKDRFWSKVDKNGPIPAHAPELGECWIWTAGTVAGTYGKFRIDCVHYGSHRVAWTLEFGEIPPGLLIMHRCDNVRCVRPAHLELGTNLENIRDMDRKGRRGSIPPVMRGEKNPSAKLTAEQVNSIRDATGRQVDIARRFGVVQTTVSRIKRRDPKGWRHVP